MSKIEKALEKSKKEREGDKGRTSIPVHGDTAQSNVHNKGTSIHDDVNIHNLKSSFNSKSERSGSHIISAIEKKGNEISTVHSPLITKDYHQLVDDSGLISQVQDTGRKNKKAESVIPSKTIDEYEVEEHIVSYYETIGQQTWIGPVMVNFRRLQVSLSGLQRSNKCKVMVFTSSLQKEGKSTIALNTAITLSNDKKKRIAIVDCDFRKPSIHRLLGFSSDKGLSDYLTEKAEMKDIVINGLVPRLTIIPAGKKPSNVSELFAADKMTHFISYMREQFDCVIIDTPPVLAFPDTEIISPLSDGVVIVINCKKTRKAIVKRTVETLRESNVIGVIMNMSETAAVDYYGYGYSSNYYNNDYASS
jgi:capsular exopolysaccharide synthesis family protein